jgi:predicted esterase
VTAPAEPVESPCPFENEVGCLDSATVATCAADGKLTERSCPSLERCLGGACVATTVDPARFRTVSPEGYLNAWSMQIGIGPKLRDEIIQGRSIGKLADGVGAKPSCGADGYINPKRAIPGEERSQTAAVLSATVTRDRGGKIELRAGVSGKLTLKIGAQTVVAEELSNREGRPLPDERFFEIDLPKGETQVIAVLEPDTGGFYLRMRDSEGRTPNLLWSEGFSHASCKSAALLDHRAELRLEKDGYHVSAAPRFRGAVPRLPENKKLELAVKISNGGKPIRDEALPFTRAGLLAVDPSRVDARFDAPEKGASEIEIALADEKLFSRKLPDDGGLSARARKLISVVEETGETSSLPAGSRASLEHHVGVIRKALALGDSDRAWLRRKIEDAEPIAEGFQRGEDVYAKKRGVVFRAYPSPLDGKLQPYVTFVPKSLDKGKPLPVVFIAHGRDRLPEHALRTLVGQAPDEHMSLSFAARNLPGMPDQSAILVAPWGYGNAGVLPVGERDLHDVLAELGRAYAIDEQRVSLTGYSLGGTVAFVAPLHRPDVFAAAAPLCGYPNLLDYASVSKVPHLPWEKAMLEKEYIVRYAENGEHVPLHIVHGGKDGPGRSKVVADRYKALGYRHVFDIEEDLDHNVWDYAYEDSKMVPWLTRHKAPVAPKSVHLATGKLRYGKAYWLRVLAMTDSSKRARVDAKLTSTGVEATTENVAAITIDTSGLGLANGEASFTIDGNASKAATGGAVTFVRDASGKLTIGEPSSTGRKMPGSSGPLDDVQQGPVSIVYGTRGRADREANRLVAEHLASLGGAADIDYPLIADVDATDEMLSGRNVVLIGGPRSNKLTAAIATLLPVEVQPDGIVLRGERHAGSHLGTSLIFPGPESFFGDGATKRSTTRYVVLHAGTTPRATLAARMLPRYLPDFVVYDAAAFGERGGLLMNTRPASAAGFFSETWQ